jgi:hypothetical protein
MEVNNTTLSKVVNMLVKPIENAGAVYLGAKLLGLSGKMSNKYLGEMDQSSQLAIGAGICSVATETVHSFVLPEITGSSQFYSTASMVLNPVLQAGLLYAYSSVNAPNRTAETGAGRIMMLGAGGEVLATYVNSAFVQPYMNRNE